MLSHFCLRHIPPLFVATTTTFGGLLPFFDAEYAIRAFGLPRHVASSRSAQSVMLTSAARISAIGYALFLFYFQGKLREFDTLLSVLGYVGLVDGYVCWREGVPKKGVFRAVSGLVIAARGFLGLTTGVH
ncbi:hypothetical protein N7462_006955 [Penicillium macrosclerotiorum]|uniref:uncharacterized protein n=1 Tax=Penicillium macrosclerotiorum TaxID=303699 RepID=UPI00254716E6|nr:uncharacterized protein N7462_006955 [Penicillium macrosclerotiorum]KAJ5678711.1 hypothetical protein N7462_006955 [Penicillium macrosclerotiorum]